MDILDLGPQNILTLTEFNYLRSHMPALSGLVGASFVGLRQALMRPATVLLTTLRGGMPSDRGPRVSSDVIPSSSNAQHLLFPFIKGTLSSLLLCCK